MPIDFCDLLSDEGWTPYVVDAASPTQHWNAGGSLADAPVDVAATFEGAMSISTEVDPAFKAYGFRCRPGFAIPRRHHAIRQLIIVHGGAAIVTWGADGSEGSETFRLGEFWTTDADTPYTITAGPEGLVYVESWPDPIEQVETWWHDHGWTLRRGDPT